jgi:hypothetical protein
MMRRLSLYKDEEVEDILRISRDRALGYKRARGDGHAGRGATSTQQMNNSTTEALALRAENGTHTAQTHHQT